jgi:hypothetical protein
MSKTVTKMTKKENDKKNEENGLKDTVQIMYNVYMNVNKNILFPDESNCVYIYYML